MKKFIILFCSMIWFSGAILSSSVIIVFHLMPKHCIDMAYFPSKIQLYNDILTIPLFALIGFGILKLMRSVRFLAIIICVFYLINFIWTSIVYKQYQIADLIFSLSQIMLLNIPMVVKAFYDNN